MEKFSAISSMDIRLTYVIALSVIMTSSAAAVVQFSVREQLPIGTEIGYVGGVDGDGTQTADRADLRYTIRQNNTLPIAVDPLTGRLTTSDVIDRETLCHIAATDCRIEFDVLLVSGTDRRQRNFDVVRVRIDVLDVNDHPPRFQFPVFNMQLSDAQCGDRDSRKLVVRLPAADDPDSPQFAIRNYSLVRTASGDDVTSGLSSTKADFKLTYTELLDGSHDVRLEVDLPIVSAEELVKILDSGSNSWQRYLAVVLVATDGGKPPLTGNMLVNLSVECIVGDRTLELVENQARAAAMIKFDNSTYHVTVPESTSTDVPIVQVHATYVSGPAHSNLQYSIKNQYPLSTGGSSRRVDAQPVFRIDSRSGEIYFNDVVDHDSGVTQYRLSVEASGLITVAATATVPVATSEVIIKVSDINDNRPVIHVVLFAGDDVICDSCQAASVATVSENVEPEVVVAEIEATDADSGLNGFVTCSLRVTSSRPPDAFVLRRRPAEDDDDDYRSALASPARYKVVTTVTFDREQRASYDLLVTCVDHGQPEPLTATSGFRVAVGDINDNRPILTSPASTGNGLIVIEVAVVENNVVGERLTTISARDADAGDNGALIYTAVLMTSSVETGPEIARGHALSVDPDTGVVSALISFDYEAVRLHELRIRVCDRPAQGKPLCTVDDVIFRVRVVDLNDERPSFERSSYRFNVAENKPEGTRVGQVVAVDADISPAYCRSVYGMLTASGEFDIDTQTGELRTIRQLDRELQSTYLLSVCAYDADRPSLYQCVNVTVDVDDVNDNYPVVIDRQRIRLSADTVIGTAIGRIAATDADVGINGRLLYTLVYPPTLEDGIAVNERLFDLDPNTGVMTLNSPLPTGAAVSQYPVYLLEVAVSDCGQPPLTSVVQLVIETVAPSAVAAVAVQSAWTEAGSSSSVSVVTLMSAFGAIMVVTVILTVVAVILVRRKAQCFRCGRHAAGRKSSASGDCASGVHPLDDRAMAELYTDLSRSLDLVARTTLCRSRDLARSAATLPGGGAGAARLYGLQAGQECCQSRTPMAAASTSSMWFSSPDCSVIGPNTPVMSSNCQTLGTRRNCRRHHSRGTDVLSRRHAQSCRHRCDVTGPFIHNYHAWLQVPEDATELPAEFRRLSSEDDDVIDDSVTSELTSECTDSGRGPSARLSS